MANLIYFFGAMNSSKTALILQRLHSYEERGFKTLLLKPLKDTKGFDEVVSRTGLKRKVDFLVDTDVNLFEYLAKHASDARCVFVDEAQFLQKEQVEQLHMFAHTFNVPVHCFGLRTDFLTAGFEGSARLLELADDIQQLPTVCKCGKPASLNARFVRGIQVFEGSQVAIDGEDEVTYDSMCPECYYESFKVYQKKNKRG